MTTLYDELRKLVDGWTMPPPQEPEKPTFESVKSEVVEACRRRAKDGCRTYQTYMSTMPTGGSPLGTTGDPDEDERILECVAAWLRKEGVMASCKRNDIPDRFDEAYQETEPGYTNVYLSVEWPPKVTNE